MTSKKKEQCVAVVEQMFALLDCKIRARDIMTRKVGGAGVGLPRKCGQGHHD